MDEHVSIMLYQQLITQWCFDDDCVVKEGENAMNNTFQELIRRWFETVFCQSLEKSLSDQTLFRFYL